MNLRTNKDCHERLTLTLVALKLIFVRCQRRYAAVVCLCESHYARGETRSAIKMRARHCVRPCVRERPIARDSFARKGGREVARTCERVREIVGVYYFQSMNIRAAATRR